ncbi:MAG: phosphoribosylpyrophosphate synthetase [Acidimicrobiales bacterium]
MANGMDTEQDAIASLRDAGYTHEFFIVEDGVRCPECDREVLAPEAVTIDQVFRFEGESDPDDMSIVFAVTNGPCGLKGVLVSAFGPEVSGPRADILRRLGT